jgi:CheY-like chemotaxis protein/HPt (histidine-containing phosphotransfer) domain-containing protein
VRVSGSQGDGLRGKSGAPGEPRIGLTVLVVDDDEVNQFVTVERVRRFGYDVVTASNGEQAVAAVGRETLAAVLMDCQMPVLDGYQATRQIRAQEAPGTRLPIIALTAHATAGDRDKVLAAGMDDYLTKPIRTEALRSALERFARGRESSSRPSVPDLTAKEHAKEHAQEVELSAGTRRSAKLIELFLRLVPAQLEALRRAAEQGDAPQLHAQSHKLKGTSASVGASRMAALCEALQHASDAGAVSDAVACVTAIEACFEALRVLLQAELAASNVG